MLSFSSHLIMRLPKIFAEMILKYLQIDWRGKPNPKPIKPQPLGSADSAICLLKTNKLELLIKSIKCVKGINCL